MNELNPRIVCKDFVSLSVQASSFAYSSPRIDGVEWEDCQLVEVGYIRDKDDEVFTPPDRWQRYGESKFPSDIYAYIPTEMVKEFIKDHGGAVAHYTQVGSNLKD